LNGSNRWQLARKQRNMNEIWLIIDDREAARCLRCDLERAEALGMTH